MAPKRQAFSLVCRAAGLRYVVDPQRCNDILIRSQIYEKNLNVNTKAKIILTFFTFLEKMPPRVMKSW